MKTNSRLHGSTGGGMCSRSSSKYGAMTSADGGRGTREGERGLRRCLRVTALMACGLAGDQNRLRIWGVGFVYYTQFFLLRKEFHCKLKEELNSFEIKEKSAVVLCYFQMALQLLLFYIGTPANGFVNTGLHQPRLVLIFCHSTEEKYSGFTLPCVPRCTKLWIKTHYIDQQADSSCWAILFF